MGALLRLAVRMWVYLHEIMQNLWRSSLILRQQIFEFHPTTIRLLNNKFLGLSPSGGHHSLLFDQRGSQILHAYSAIWPIRQYFVSMRLYPTMLFIL